MNKDKTERGGVMEADKYRMKMLHIEILPDNDDAASIKQMIETDKYNWREQGLTKRQVKERMVKKLYAAWLCTGSKKYHHAYSLLHRFVDKGRER